MPYLSGPLFMAHVKLYAFLGAIAKLLKAIISVVISVCLSVRPSAWNKSVPTGRVFITFGISVSSEVPLTTFNFH
jgi:hypothetical protein